MQTVLGLEDNSPWIMYLRSLRDLNSTIVQKELDLEFEEKIETFQFYFEELHREFGLPETLKVRL